jgi:hypothetical protein
MGLPAFLGAVLSKEYTKTFVSRKNLPLIHLVPAEAVPRMHMLQAFHQGVEFLSVAALWGFRTIVISDSERS